MSSQPPDSIRNRSNSAEDMELPTHDRKRPRLANGTELHTTSSPASLSPRHQFPPSLSNQRSPESTLPPAPSSMLASPLGASKVTINTRPLSSQSMNRNGDTATSSDDIDPTLIRPSGRGESLSQQPEQVVQERSPSPPIDVAEPEDFDEDPAATRWTTRIGNSTPSDRTNGSLHIYQTFPYARKFRPGEGHKAVNFIHRLLFRSQEDSCPIFRRVAAWVIDFAQECDTMTHQLLNEEPQFWAQLPHLFYGLWQFDVKPLSSLPTAEIIKLLVAYGRLTRIIVEYDLLQLSMSETDTQIRPLTGAYLSPLSMIVKVCTQQVDNRDALFLTRLKRCRDEDVLTCLDAITRALLDTRGTNLLASIARYSTVLGSKLQLLPALSVELEGIADAVILATQSFSQVILPEQFCVLTRYEDQKLEVMQVVEAIVQTLDNTLQLAIKKQHSWLNIKTAQQLIHKISIIMSKLPIEVPAIGQRIITTATRTFEDADLAFLDQTMPQAWCLWTFWTLMKYGRMELRVYGIDMMGSDLIKIWKDRICEDPEGQQDPLVKYVVRFLRANDIVNYVIGVDSHSQLTGRAGNLVGFFGVAGAFENVDTDIMWQTILEAPDPRIATEVLRTLESSLQAINIDHIYHICEKLAELPHERWNEDIHRFVLSIFQQFPIKLGYPYYGQYPSVEPVVRLLCIKVLRDSLHPSVCGTEMAQKLLADFGPRLAQFFQVSRYNVNSFDMSADEESDVFSRLRDDITQNTDFAGGAIYTIYHILRGVQAYMAITARVAEMCDLPDSLLGNIIHITNSLSSESVVQRKFRHQMDCRIRLLGQLMSAVPERFNQISLELLWHSILTNQDLDPYLRNQAWENITSTVKLSEKYSNPVIDAILQHFWPLLKPNVMHGAVLLFAQEAVTYDCRFNAHSSTLANDIVKIPGVDRVRRIMLEAAPNTVEVPAADFIISTYLQHPAMKQPKAVVHATHLALIDEFVAMVLGSASKLQYLSDVDRSDDSMEAIIASPEETLEEELRFDRSLLFLRRFTESIKTRPGSSPLNEDLLPEFLSPKGEVRTLVVEAGSSKFVAPGPHQVSVGIENTGAELWQYLAAVTGFSNFKAYHCGQHISLQHEQRTIAELRIMAKVQVQRTQDTRETEPSMRMRSTSPVDEKIMLHYDALFSLLDAQDRLAKEVYDFLSITSVRKEVGRNLRQMNCSACDALPCAKPYKLLFMVQALRTIVEEETLSTSPDAEFIAFAIHALLAAVSKLPAPGFQDSLHFSISEEMMDTMLLALRAKVPSGYGESSYFSNHAAFVTYNLQFIAHARRSFIPRGTARAVKSIRAGLETLIEGALHDKRVWEYLSASRVDFVDVLRDYTFHFDTRVRQTLAELMTGMTGQIGTKVVLKMDTRSARARHDPANIEACLLELWRRFQPLLVEASKHSCQCHEFLEICAGFLKALHKTLKVETITAFYSSCALALLNHEHVEAVGKPLEDRLIAGMAPLLEECARILREHDALPSQTTFIEQLINGRLFPFLSPDSNGASRLPVIDTSVRESLYRLVLSLCQKPADIDIVIRQAGDDFADENFTESCFNGDRLSLRSEVGYAGLVNLSNTCYLNSLLSQLFMNVDFRKFILEKGESRRDHSKIVFELAKVFAFMQSSFNKDVDTSAVVDSIVTYDGDKIDVSVQMDVDEFFNLLTDRLENQLFDQPSKAAFKAFYGGQVIQQIKSMECTHVSERPEPFSVVPVEIKGKNSLEESLEAYVEGEILQGDNKYSCTSCGKNVDAVKRACFKQIGNHLIFNLKRFDYDILTYMRTKLNDRFEFPESIDMAPYTLDRITKGGKADHTSDMFDLVGVIVHSGTAETGHYYSFIRERPSSSPEASWVHFNDSDVMPFDKTTLADSCFGGVDLSMLSMAKFYNAYMLFYQRKSDIQLAEQRYTPATTHGPLHVRGPNDVENFIRQSNELHLRAYVIQDPAHAWFVRGTVRRHTELRPGRCSDDHMSEAACLRTALRYMTEVSMRWKVLPAVEETAQQIGRRMELCGTCASLVISWLVQDHRRFTAAFVRNSYAPARQALAAMIITGLRSLSVTASMTHEEEATSATYLALLGSVVKVLANAWLPVTRTRFSWTEYFALLTQISQLDRRGFVMILGQGILKNFLDIILLHNMDCEDSSLQQRYAEYLNLREKRREFNHEAMVECFYRLLAEADLQLQPRGGERVVLLDEDRVGLSPPERHRLGFDRGLPWLKKLINGGHVEAPVRRLTALLAGQADICEKLAGMLLKGQEKEVMSQAVNYLNPTLTFFASCCDKTTLFRLAAGCVKNVATIELDYGLEFLRFMQAWETVANETLDIPEGFLDSIIQAGVASWGPPLLMGHNESGVDVRAEAYTLVNTSFISRLEEAVDSGSSNAASLQETAASLLIEMARVGSQHFLQQNASKNVAIEEDHFRYVIKTFERCQTHAFPGCEDETGEQPDEYGQVKTILHRLAHKREAVVDLTSQNDYDGSSDLEELSEGAYDSEGFKESPI